jgi:hypothetical protein
MQRADLHTHVGPFRTSGRGPLGQPRSGTAKDVVAHERLEDAASDRSRNANRPIRQRVPQCGALRSTRGRAGLGSQAGWRRRTPAARPSHSGTACSCVRRNGPRGHRVAASNGRAVPVPVWVGQCLRRWSAFTERAAEGHEHSAEARGCFGWTEWTGADGMGRRTAEVLRAWCSRRT